MPETRIARLVGIDSATQLALSAALNALGYSLGEDRPTIAFVQVAAADDEPALLAIAAADCPVIALLEPGDAALLAVVTRAGARGILDLPVRRGAVAPQVALAIAAVAHHHRLMNKVALLERTLKSRRTIEKATQVLATVRGITQAAAYEVLRKTAMNRRVTMADTANDYLATIEAAAGAEPEQPVAS